MMYWTPRRKAALLAAIESNQIKRPPDLSQEELDSWRQDSLLFGEAGLRSTRLQTYRPSRLRKRNSHARSIR